MPDAAENDEWVYTTEHVDPNDPIIAGLRWREALEQIERIAGAAGSGEVPAMPLAEIRTEGAGAVTAAHIFESAHPELRSTPAEQVGTEGFVTVWDHEGRYVGCMGADLWRMLLTVEAERRG